MTVQPDKLKLGKGVSFFVKTQLRRLRQEDDTWEADFFPIPCSDSEAIPNFVAEIKALFEPGSLPTS
jgi:hypothetical protein